MLSFNPFSVMQSCFQSFVIAFYCSDASVTLKSRHNTANAVYREQALAHVYARPSLGRLHACILHYATFLVVQIYT